MKTRCWRSSSQPRGDNRQTWEELRESTLFSENSASLPQDLTGLTQATVEVFTTSELTSQSRQG